MPKEIIRLYRFVGMSIEEDLCVYTAELILPPKLIAILNEDQRREAERSYDPRKHRNIMDVIWERGWTELQIVIEGSRPFNIRNYLIDGGRKVNGSIVGSYPPYMLIVRKS